MAVENIQGNTAIEIKSGGLQIVELTGTAHRFIASCGRTVIEKVRGKMESQVLSGSLTMRAFSGEGSFEISSGNIDLDYAGTFRGSAVYRFKRGYSPDPSQGSVF